MDNLQTAVDKATDWGVQNGLAFNASKTVVVIFSYKYKIVQPKKLKMGGLIVPFSPSVKYLGVTLDTKLNWNIHIQEKINKAKNLLLMSRRAIGIKFGPSPTCLSGLLQAWFIQRPNLCIPNMGKTNSN